MLAQTETIGEAARKMDAWVKDLQGTALQLEKNVEKEDLSKKTAMVNAAALDFIAHVDGLEADLQPIKLIVPRPDFATAIKGKRNYASMQDAVDTLLSQSKSAASEQAKDVRAKLAWCKEHAAGHSALLPDLQSLMAKPMEDFTLTITSRIEKQKADEAARLEAQRAAIQAEEEAKARAKIEAEARATVEAEQRTKAEDQAKIDTAAELAAESAKNGTKEKTNQSEPVMQDGARSALVHTEPAVPSIKLVAKLSRPSDKELITFVAQNFNVSYGIAYYWIIETAERLKVAA
jgi:Xaa-Pro aminopeptidase